jgi:hypothetical protein
LKIKLLRFMDVLEIQEDEVDDDMDEDVEDEESED